MAVAAVPTPTAGAAVSPKPPFRKILAANRGEIAVRIFRAATEAGCGTVGIFAHEDRYSPHRYKSDESFVIGEGLSPVGAYLSIPHIVKLCKDHGVSAVHPGYGFLSENADFADALKAAGVTFIGPSGDVLRMFGDKTHARAAAIRAGVSVVPGTPGPVASVAEAREFAEKAGFPVIIKAAHGGGGRGMRVCRSASELAAAFELASSEAKAAFGDGTVFVEKFIEHPRHIEVQILADKYGNIIHLYERDCSVQRRHQKVVELAPSLHLPPATREAVLRDAVRLCSEAKYENAGTVEFLVDRDGRHYFMEVNPRVQVEHTVTEEVTGVDIVQTQMRIAAGESLPSMGLTQDRIRTSGVAIQCRITTEDPSNNFTPDTGVISVYRSATGPGIRLDEGPGFSGSTITPHYDSLLVKVTARAASFEAACRKMTRALREFRIRGVTTNKDFLLNVLRNDDFLSGPVTTRFIEEHPELTRSKTSKNRGEKLLRYLAHTAVNGPEKSLGATGPPPAKVDPVVPHLPPPKVAPRLREILRTQGPAAFAKAVRESPHALVMDTTWRDAHQSLLATRVRTRDILAIAPATRAALASAYSLENWGGATFDVAMRFLRECPWDRLALMREAVPDIPFQMLLRGANAVGYTSYPDNAVFKFCELSVKYGMDVFRVFDSLNYLPNLQLGIEAAGAAGGVVEAAICYTGDVARPHKGRYDLDYYLKLAHDLTRAGTHVLCIKDMAGLLRPDGARLLVGALRREFPAMPIHIHTHDTAGTGVASMIAAVEAGADVVDGAIDSMSGMTSQPSLGALVAGLQGSARSTDLDLDALSAINQYWEACRAVYAPFESGQLSGSSDVYENEIPGGQYTNMLYQSKQLGLVGQWTSVKQAYAAANRILGDIVKVTPSSKVVGDLAQFMVANKLSEADVLAQASTLNFPESVIEYLQGYLGIPHYGFPEPFRTQALRGRKLPSGKSFFEGRPGAEMAPLDFAAITRDLREKYGSGVEDKDVMSYVMYPKVFDEWADFVSKFGDVSVLPTRAFISRMADGDEISFEIEPGKLLYVRMKFVESVDKTGHREVVMELNGEQRIIRVPDESVGGGKTRARAKADKSNKGHVGAPMPGVIVDLKVKIGQEVEQGQAIAVLSAMKMESQVGAPRKGKVTGLFVGVKDAVTPGDLIATVEA